MLIKQTKILACAALLGGLTAPIQAQNTIDFNTITTAVPFLTISPDGRHGSLGDAGVATSPDVSATHWNVAKLAFAEEQSGIGLSYTPWLRQLVNDIDMSYLSYYKRLDKMSTFSASFRYFSLGYIQFTDEFGNNTIQHRPNEFAFDGGYARKLSDRWSGGLNLRFVYSNLTGGQNVAGADTKAGIAAATDVTAFYTNDDATVFNNDATVSLGIALTNIGNKMAYSDLNDQDFLPMNFRIGPAVTLHLDDYNDVSFNMDVNKLMVPTNPIYDLDGSLVSGMDPNRSVASALFTSWFDAPGVPLTDENGDYILNDDGTAQVEKGSIMAEELREFYFGFGMEYWYNKVFAARMGYFTEHLSKGNRKHLTFGIGLKYNVFGMDFSYLVPAYFGKQNNSASQNSPLQNTLRFSLTFDFAALDNDGGGTPPAPGQ